jgi:hypothetical protein
MSAGSDHMAIRASDEKPAVGFPLGKWMTEKRRRNERTKSWAAAELRRLLSCPTEPTPTRRIRKPRVRNR